jgi:hypothetical protein
MRVVVSVSKIAAYRVLQKINSLSQQKRPFGFASCLTSSNKNVMDRVTHPQLLVLVQGGQRCYQR